LRAGTRRCWRDYVDHGTHDEGRQARAGFDRDVETAIYNTLPDNLDRLIRRHPLKCPVAFIGGIRSPRCSRWACHDRKLVKGRIMMLDGSHLFPMEKPWPPRQRSRPRC
jgi:pimeloyl-ACP methyl ester carboxylesterase